MNDIEAILDAEGVRGALRWLNEQVPHRYSAIYERQGKTLHNLYVFDKQNPAIRLFTDEPIIDTYCHLVFDTESNIQITNASSDSRVQQHPKRTVVESYCGVPLRLANGEVFGTVCHFDPEPQTLNDAELQVLEAAAQKIAPRLASMHGADAGDKK